MARLPEGFRYVEALISAEEEAELIARAREVAIGEVRMRGQVGRRRVAHFGYDYGYESWKVSPTAARPGWLVPLRDRAAAWAGIEPARLAEVLVTVYPPGAGIGWHKDAMAFGEPIVGVSLLGPCRMRFQREHAGAREVAAIDLAPRSAYLFSGPARWSWQHQIPPVKSERFSITFRPLRAA
jgi:alkylated DNA repair protein (DNA oxidative demethylase)